MDERDIELLRMRLGSALIYLFKATVRYGLDDDLTRAKAAIEQASAILGPIRVDVERQQ
ncbi:hypothetical protein [Paraburkholderia sp. BL25I1N1]|uniref:hypothetical protein n=1 Tax=Paraburkholderia sp. BL25I1N1 TaxID=1938804 RepID=UPI000D45F400|nr:hypothetical protein [Paraburkholderia sp. BL25I1N1]PRY03814.1 hypothetical protein B0G73_114135 [Paraburkholderia sp. BL25I1N1]